MFYSLLTKLVPASWFAWIKLEEREKAGDEAEAGFMGTVRRQSTIARSKTTRTPSRRVRVVDDDDYNPNINA